MNLENFSRMNINSDLINHYIILIQRKKLIYFDDLIYLYQTYKFARHRILSCLCTCIYSPFYENNSSQFENILQISEFEYRKEERNYDNLIFVAMKCEIPTYEPISCSIYQDHFYCNTPFRLLSCSSIHSS